MQMGSLTGAEIVSATSQNDSGTTYFNLEEIVSVTLDDDQISLGTGTINSSFSTATLESLNATSVGGVGFVIGPNTSSASKSDSFRIRNDGTLNVTLDINASKNASTFVGDITQGANATNLGVTAAKLEGIFNNTDDLEDSGLSCTYASQAYGFGLDAQNPGSEDINAVFVGRFDNYTPGQLLRICDDFTFQTVKDELDMFVRVVVPDTGIKGNRSTTIEFMATGI